MITQFKRLLASGLVFAAFVMGVRAADLSVAENEELKVSADAAYDSLTMGAGSSIVLADGSAPVTLTIGTFKSAGVGCKIGDGVTLVVSNSILKGLFDGDQRTLDGVMKVNGIFYDNSNGYTLSGSDKQNPGELWLTAKDSGLQLNSNKSGYFQNLRIVAAGGRLFSRMYGHFNFTDVTFATAGSDADVTAKSNEGGDVYLDGTVMFDTADAFDGTTPRTITLGSYYDFAPRSGKTAIVRKTGVGTLVWSAQKKHAPTINGGIFVDEGTLDYRLTAFNSSVTVAEDAELKLDLSSKVGSRACADGCAVHFAEGAKLTVVTAEDLQPGVFALIDRLTPETDISKIVKTVVSETLKGEFSRDGDRLILTLVDDSTYVWTGNGSTPTFSDPDNWMGGKVPSAGGTVCLGSADGDVTIENDIDGLTFASLTFVDSSKGKVTLAGKPVTLSETVVNGAPMVQAVACAVNFPADSVTIETGVGLELAGGFTAAGAVALSGAADGDGLTLGGESTAGGDFTPGVVEVKGSGSLVCDGNLMADSNTKFGLAHAQFSAMTVSGSGRTPHFTGGYTVFTNEVGFSKATQNSRIFVDEGAVVDMTRLWGSYYYHATVDGVLNISGQFGNDGGSPTHSGTGVINAGRCAWGSWLNVNLTEGLTVNTKGTASFGGQGTQHLTLGDATFGCSDGDLTIGMTLDLPSEKTGTLRASDTNGVARMITVNKALTGTGKLLKTGAGTVVLKAATAGTNAVTIAAGALEVQETMTVSDLTFAEGGELRLKYGATEAPVAVCGTADLSNATFSFAGERQRVKTPLLKVVDDGEIINYENVRVVTAGGAVDGSWKFVLEDGVLFAKPKPGLILLIK